MTMKKQYRNFLSHDILISRFTKLIGKENVRKIGKSKGGESILCGSIGRGKKAVIMFGYPHPNEPVGSLTCLEWVRYLNTNVDLLEEYTWHIIPCIDPDGAKLNEGWFKGGFSIEKYAKNFYRQINEQTDWGFPVSYKDYSFNKPAKPTKALMKLIDEVKPSIIYSLHNSSFNGAYFLQSRSLGESFFNNIEKICQKSGVKLNKGEPEAPFIKQFRPGFFRLFSIKEEYDFLEKIKQNPVEQIIGGDSSAAYGKRINKKCFSLVCEVPYLYDPKLADIKKSTISQKDVLELMLNDNQFVRDSLKECIQVPSLNKKSIFYKITKENIKVMEGMVASQEKMLVDAKLNNATRAQEFSARVISPFYRTLFLGEAYRLFLESGEAKEIKRQLKDLNRIIKMRVKDIEKHSEYQVVPIETLINLQMDYFKEALKYL
jgi:hypothetical protein